MTNKTTHYIIDEELSGGDTVVEREYIEVDREAEVGDYFVALVELIGITRGGVYQVESLTRDRIHGIKGRHFLDDDGRDRAVWSPHKYKTLNPTDIVRIDGKRYRLSDRRANVGEKILVVEYEGFYVKAHKGDILIIEEVDDECVAAKGQAIFFHDNSYDDKYYVLEPADALQTTESLIANLASEVARLTRKVAELEEQTDSNRKDIVKQAEEFAELKGVDAEEVAEHLLTEVLMRERGTK